MMQHPLAPPTYPSGHLMPSLLYAPQTYHIPYHWYEVRQAKHIYVTTSRILDLSREDDVMFLRTAASVTTNLPSDCWGVGSDTGESQIEVVI